MTGRIFKFSVMALFLVCARLAADDEVEAVVSSAPVIVGETAQFRLSSSVSYPVIIRLPEIDGLTWQGGNNTSMRTEIVNYKRKVTAENIYTFVVSKPGTYEIPALKVRVGSKEMETEPVKFKAYKRKFSVESGKAKGIEDLIFMKAALLSDSKSFYVGEEIPAVVRIYIYNGMNVSLLYPNVETENVIFRDYGKVNDKSDKFAPARESRERVDGQTFSVYVFRTSFRALAKGSVSVKFFEDCEIRVPRQRRRTRSLFDDDFFSGFGSFATYKTVSHRLEASIKDIDIKPLPKEPDGSNYLGLVGNWHVGLSLSSDSFKVGEPVTLLANIRGYGSLETLTAPKLNIPGFRVYPAEVDRKPTYHGAAQTAEIKYVLLPLKEGPANIFVSMSVFSTARSSFKEFKLDKNCRIEKGEGVSGGQVYAGGLEEPEKSSEANEENKKHKRQSGILYLKKFPMGKIDLPLWRNHFILLFVLIVLAPFVLLFSELVNYRRRRLSSDPKLRRKLSAQASKGSVLRKLKKASAEELDGVVQKDVVPYLNDLLGLPPGTTASELAEKVKSSELADCLSHSGASSYMPGSGHVDKMELKNKMRKALKKFAVLAFIFILPFSAFSAGKEKASNANGQVKSVDEALIAYDNGDFSKAASYYKSKINPHSPDPALLYNLGNCYCQEGNFSKALVCYERAHRLAPRDSDITENMNYVRRKLFLPEEGAAKNPLELLLNLRDDFRPDQWLLIAAFLWFLSGFILAFRRSIPGRKWVFFIFLAAFCFAVCLAAVVSQYYSTYSDNEAVVIAKNVPVYSLPSEKSTKAEFRLKDGEKVEIEEQRLDWVRVRADNAEGWIHGKEVARLWGSDWSGFLNGNGKIH